MGEELDKVQFGRLIESVERLNQSVEKLTQDMERINERLNTGKGIVTGMMLAAGSIGGGLGAFAHSVLQKLGEH
jgi:hypothetical protein